MSTCDSSTEYLTGLHRSGKSDADPNLSTRNKDAAARLPAPNQHRASTCKTANWWGALDKTNVWAICPNGYFVRGFYRTDGDWLHNIEGAKCCINECTKSPCKNGATCVNLQGSYRCNCKSGYSGNNCQTDINECTSQSPCKNGATCVNKQGGYQCNCKSGYSGNNCETEPVPDEC
ncbi:hypothetical protein OS493_031651 [Desmophyllum pertusum]|uniref:EGF-like domain-containing protein n=1 Tax=Desmophyllum pertusum TaxID=174260 RepID=A0A9W9YBT3_9CNID|nr:hypothetical protein OS493_031651 [Desmophyllum pertusum]